MPSDSFDGLHMVEGFIFVNYYSFHIGDYIRDTAHLEPMEDLCYRRLIDLYYTSEAPIPKETDWVSRRLRLGSDLVTQVLSEFFEEGAEGWSHKRCEEEIAAFQHKAEVARRNGQRGGRPTNKGKKPTGFNLLTQEEPKANPEETKSKANQYPVPKNQEPRTKGQESLTLPFEDEDFKAAWEDWKQHRKEIKKPLTPTSTKLQFQTLKEMGVERSIKAIDLSIEKGWQGIHEHFVSQHNTTNGNKPKTTSCL